MNYTNYLNELAEDGLEPLTSVRQSWTESRRFRDKQMWPPSSTDINPMDFAIWSILERDVSTHCHPNSDLLTAVIQSAWTKLGEKVARLFCASSKLKAAISEFSLFITFW